MESSKDKDPPQFVTIKECGEVRIALERRLAAIEAGVKATKWQIGVLIAVMNIIVMVVMFALKIY